MKEKIEITDDTTFGEIKKMLGQKHYIVDDEHNWHPPEVKEAIVTEIHLKLMVSDGSKKETKVFPMLKTVQLQKFHIENAWDAVCANSGDIKIEWLWYWFSNTKEHAIKSYNKHLEAKKIKEPSDEK